MPRATGMRKAHGLKLRLPRARCAFAMTRPATPVCHCEEGVSPTRQSRNHQIRTNLFVCTVRRFAGGWGMPHPYIPLSHPLCRAGTCPRRVQALSIETVGRDHWARRVQELPNPHKPIRPHRPPLRGTDGACPIPTVVYRKISVGRGHAPAACRNYRIRTKLFVCPVRRFAGGTPGRRALRTVERTFSVGRDHWARRCRNYQSYPICLYRAGDRPCNRSPRFAACPQKCTGLCTVFRQIIGKLWVFTGFVPENVSALHIFSVSAGKKSPETVDKSPGKCFTYCVTLSAVFLRPFCRRAGNPFLWSR